MKYWEWKKPFNIKADKTALIIVDMQKGFVDEGGALFTPQAKEQIPLIKDLKDFCKENNIPVFLSVFAQDENNHNAFYWYRNEQRGLLNPDGSAKFKPETRDTEITDGLKVDKNDHVFNKYTYSCFAHTELDKKLKELGIETLIICGTCTDWCVDSTVRDAYHKDYNVVVVADGVSTYPHAGATPEQWNSMLLDLWGEGFGRVEKSQDIKQEIENK